MAEKLLRLFLRDKLHEEVIGDLKENFDYDIETRTPFRANLNYWKQVFHYFRPFAMRTPRFVNLLINGIMIGSYLKTSVRNVSRNKLFSTINILGLAVSMSVGLLLIAFTHDLLSYDRFNEKGSRIYRITSHAKFKGGHHEDFATSAVKAGELIRENVSGLESVAILRGGFSGDASISGNVIPFTGMYAEPSMLSIFTLPMLKGDFTTALKNPYSIVLTETSAKKLFGTEDAFGKTIHFDSLDFVVTGILKDVPFFSHIQFESLVSFSTIESQMSQEPSFLKWESVWQRNYIYLLLPEGSNTAGIQAQIDAICADENRMTDEAEVHLTLLPLHDIMLGDDLGNSLRPIMPRIVRLDTGDPIGTMAKIQEVWKRFDPVHPFKAQFYDDAIEEAYNELSAMIKVIGFLSIIAISIASLGLLGMVVFTTETRIREMSIRKVLGATSGNLVLLLSRGFVVMLVVSALVALPVTYLFFENVVLTNFPFHNPIGVIELFGGFLAILAIAFMMIGSLSLRTANANPAEVLKSE